jgi:hypothetical protein
LCNKIAKVDLTKPDHEAWKLMKLKVRKWPGGYVKLPAEMVMYGHHPFAIEFDRRMASNPQPDQQPQQLKGEWETTKIH